MKNGTIILTIDESDDPKVKFVLNQIKRVSKSPYTHAQIWANNILYETRHPDGFTKKVTTLPMIHPRKHHLVPDYEFTKEECIALDMWFNWKIRHDIPYGYAKLFTSFLLVETRPFWETIKWIPFQDDNVFGNHCSSGIAEFLDFIDRWKQPDKYPEISAPVDLMSVPGYSLKVS